MYPAIRRSLSQIVRQIDTPICSAARDGRLGHNFCTTTTVMGAEFAIAHSKWHGSVPATTWAAAPAPPLPHLKREEVQYQCDYLHPCNIFPISTVLVRIFSCPCRSSGPCRGCAMTPVTPITAVVPPEFSSFFQRFLCPPGPRPRAVNRMHNCNFSCFNTMSRKNTVAPAKPSQVSGNR